MFISCDAANEVSYLPDEAVQENSSQKSNIPCPRKCEGYQDG